MDLKQKYQNGVLGFLWSFLKPLIQFFAYYAVFGIILKVGKSAYYPVELFLGILTWAWFAESTNLSIGAFLSKKPIITQIATNKLYPPLATFLAPTMNYILNLLVFFIAYIAIFKFTLLTQTPYSFLHGGFVFCEALVMFSFIIVSFNILLAYLNARFRDVQAIWELIVTYGIFATPVFYVVPIPAGYETLYFILNPLAYPLLLLKSVFFPIALPELSLIAHVGGWLIIVFLWSAAIFTHRKLRGTIADFI